jgi:hypothetical protein
MFQLHRPRSAAALSQRLETTDFGDLFETADLIAGVRADLRRRGPGVLTLHVEAACRGVECAELRDKHAAGARLRTAYAELLEDAPVAAAA